MIRQLRPGCCFDNWSGAEVKIKRHFAMAVDTSCGWLGGLKRCPGPTSSHSPGRDVGDDNRRITANKIDELFDWKCRKPGVLTEFARSPVERAAPGPGEVEIQVQVTGLNFRDVLCTLGMYPGEFGALGAECAGVVTRTGEGVEKLEPGDKVMAVARGGFDNLRDPACRPCCSPARWGVTCRGSVDSSRLPHGILRFASFGSYESRRSGAHSCRGRWRGTGRCPTGAAGLAQKSSRRREASKNETICRRSAFVTFSTLVLWISRMRS